MEIEGLEESEFTYDYSRDEEELAFVTAFPTLSYFYLHGGSVTLSLDTGIVLKNRGGSVKGPRSAGAAPQSGGDGLNVDEFLRSEEMAASSAYLDMRPELAEKIYGKMLQGGNADGVGGTAPEPPLLKFSFKFPKIAKALASSGGAVVLTGDGKGTYSPAALTLEGGQGSVVAEVAARGHDKTLRGSLALLEAAMPE